MRSSENSDLFVVPVEEKGRGRKRNVKYLWQMTGVDDEEQVEEVDDEEPKKPELAVRLLTVSNYL